MGSGWNRMEHFGTLFDECRPGERHVNRERFAIEAGRGSSKMREFQSAVVYEARERRELITIITRAKRGCCERVRRVSV